MKSMFKYWLSAAFLLVSAAVLAQSPRHLVTSGDKALSSYNFEAAKGDYTRALERTQDSTERVLLMEKITYCENGLSMLQYASRPQVISTITVPRTRFFLYYSHFPDKAWRKGPDGTPFLYTDDMDTVVIPTDTGFGTHDLMFATREGGRWSQLADMGSGVNSVDDEALAVLSEDGKKVYFSSKGLYGMGGYDIFVSEWDEARKQWGVAENLGFPYSSPYDDLLFCNTPDGNFSLFASNRACGADSIVIYLLKYDPKPVKSAIESVEQARAIASLRPRPDIKLDIDESQFSHTMYDDDSFARYFNLVGNYGAVKDSIKTLQNSVADSRKALSDSIDSELKAIARSVIKDAEKEIMALQGRLGDLSAELQAVEMEFLVRGEEISPEEFEQASLEQTFNSGGPVAKPQYSFIQRTMGQMPAFDFAEPEVKTDYNFRVGEESLIISDFKLPDALVYQIQVAATSNKLDAGRLKGLNPAFEFRSGGKYIYRIGLFDTYSEANKRLATVKKKGFSSAVVVAFDNGKNINLKNARSLEEKRKESQKYRVVFRNYPEGIPSAVLKVIRDNCSVDIARGNEDGRTVYFIAPLDRSAAGKLRDAAVAAGADGVDVERVNQ